MGLRAAYEALTPASPPYNKMEKSKFGVKVVNSTDNESDTPDQIDDSPHWRTGYRARFPFIGIGSLVAVLISAGAAAAVLVASDRKSATHWSKTLAPNVLLSIINAFSNIMLAVAITQGVAIAWWRKAMKGATVRELHHSWNYSTSFGYILTHFWSLDAVALAALATKVAIIDSVFFQRATSAYTAQDPETEIRSFAIAATEFPQTGYVVGMDGMNGAFMISDTYTPVVNKWETSNGFFAGYQDYFRTCDGTCLAHIDAIGFEIDCADNSIHTDIATVPVSEWASNDNGTKGDASQWSDIAIFNSSFYMNFAHAGSNFSHLHLDLVYFQSDNPDNPSPTSCPGTMTNITCTLRPAVLTYPVTVMNYANPRITNGLSLGFQNTSSDYSYFNKQAEGFTVGEYITPPDEMEMNTATYLGGISNAVSQFLSSVAAITYTGTSTWSLSQQGTLAQTMMYGPPNMGTCDCSFRTESLTSIVASINQLTFMTAIGLIDDSSFVNKTVQAGTQATVVGINQNTTATFQELQHTRQIADVIHYQTHYLFVGLGLGSMIICILLVLPSFWRYGELGRDVTLGPIEIASAFRAPMLHDDRRPGAADGDVRELIRDVGDRKVMYGFVDEKQSSDELNTEEPQPTLSAMSKNRQSVRLVIAEPKRVRPVSGAYSNPSHSRPSTPGLKSPRLT